MASTSASPAKMDPKGKLTQEQIVAGFQELRNQQRAIASKISELEMERKEHDLVIEALKEVEADRKCFRMVGKVLVERTVKDVLPALSTNHQQLGNLVKTLSAQLEAKGKELIEYRDKYNIRVKGEEENDSKSSSAENTAKSGTTGVLVDKNSS